MTSSKLEERVATGGSTSESYQVESLMGRQLLASKQREVIVACSGDSVADAVNQGFQRMRKQLFAEEACPIIRMEAEEVWFDEVTCTEQTEHFMLVFWPRVKKGYKIIMRILVAIEYLEIEEGEN